ncbi:hypothetical protein [Nonomuraea sp. NPDC005650]|uniref:hypothetical protein n=1 Tax=Nonomuraea sp. NPDC005650 TaxID=3157045 RepID=UPI0033ABD658
MCPHYNVLTDAEWARLTADKAAAHGRNATCLCESAPGHPGPHLAPAQSYGNRDTWIRRVDGVREPVDLAHCLAAGIPADDLADDPEPCHLFDGHPGSHSFDPGAAPVHPTRG